MIRPFCLFAVFLLVAATDRRASATDFNWSGTVVVSSAASWGAVANYNPDLATLPGPADRVVFTGVAIGSLNTVLDNSFGITGVVVRGTVPGAADPVLIGPGLLGGGAANTLTVGTGGLDLSAANKSLTVTSRFVVGADQPWAVNALRTLTLGNLVSSPAAQVLTLNGAAGNTGAVVLGAANSFAATSSLTLRAGSLRADNAAALTGLTGSGGTSGITLDPLSTATLGLNAAGIYSNSLKLVGTSPSVQSVVNGLAAGTTTLSGPVTVAGGGLVALNVAGGGALNLTNTVNGPAFGGTLQLGGASGTGRLDGAVTLVSGGLVKADAGSTWTLAAANAWSTTAVRAGTLRTTVAGALPPSGPFGGAASMTLGTASSAAVGTLDLFGTSQQVGGLTTTSSDSLVNPADNRIGIGDGAGPAPISTLNFSGPGPSLFAGTLVDNVGVSAGKTVFLTVSGGSLTLQSANTYSGATLVTSGTLALGSRIVPFGATTNFGSFANSPTVTVRSGAALNVAGATGGLNSLGGQFAPVANQTLRGEGGVTGAVTVPAAATLRGGEPTVSPNGQLSVAGAVTIQGGPVGSGGGQLGVDLNFTSTSGTLVGRVAVTGGNAFNLDVTGGPVTLRLVGSQNLVYGTPYTFDVATAGAFQRNGTPGVTSYTFGPAGDFVLSADSVPLNAYIGTPTLTAASGTLTLGFTPVPEPATVLAVAAVGLGAARLRRRILAG